jgi:hypothetical protein
MCFEVCGINRDSLIVRGLFGQSHHDPSEHAHITPVDRQHMRSMCKRGASSDYTVSSAALLDRCITPA